jgi:hypothetical protein
MTKSRRPLPPDMLRTKLAKLIEIEGFDDEADFSRRRSATA